jgi:hypothetical protein
VLKDHVVFSSDTMGSNPISASTAGNSSVYINLGNQQVTANLYVPGSKVEQMATINIVQNITQLASLSKVLAIDSLIVTPAAAELLSKCFCKRAMV